MDVTNKQTNKQKIEGEKKLKTKTVNGKKARYAKPLISMETKNITKKKLVPKKRDHRML